MSDVRRARLLGAVLCLVLSTPDAGVADGPVMRAVERLSAGAHRGRNARSFRRRLFDAWRAESRPRVSRA